MNSNFFDKNEPTPIESIVYCLENGQQVDFAIKRDDLIDKHISGNKWRKLKFNALAVLNDNNYQGIASFGGAFSNHIAALAALGNQLNIPTLGFIRCHEIDINNPTLKRAQQMGMELVPLSREQYKQRNQSEFIEQLRQQYPDYFLVPEGGSNDLASQGLKELAYEISEQSSGDYDYIACAIGSGGTIQGLLDAMPEQKFIGVAVVNDTELLTRLTNKYHDRLIIITDNLTKGYGKTNDQLNHFCLNFYRQTNVPVEPVYTGKLMYQLVKLLGTNNAFKTTKVLTIHTGGLQGIKGQIFRCQCRPDQWQPIIDHLDF